MAFPRFYSLPANQTQNRSDDIGELAVLVAPMGAFLFFNNKGQIDWIPRPTVLLVAHALGFLTGGGVVLLFFAYFGACIIATVCLAQTNRARHSIPTDSFSVRLPVHSVIFPPE